MTQSTSKIASSSYALSCNDNRGTVDGHTVGSEGFGSTTTVHDHIDSTNR